MGIAIATATGECWVLLDAVSGAIFLDSKKIIVDLVSSKYGVGKRIHDFGELDGTHACINTQKNVCIYTVLIVQVYDPIFFSIFSLLHLTLS